MAVQSFLPCNRRKFSAIAFLTISFAALAHGEHPSSLNWRNCTVDNFPALANVGLPEKYFSVVASTPEIQCTELQVPVDWGCPDGEKITIGMTKYSAAAPEKRLGSLIYNPGGPGEAASLSGLAQAIGLPSYSNATIANYDVIGMDPRGIGLSTPVKCDPKLYNKQVSLFPSNEKEFKELVDANKALGESCRDKTGELFFHLDTTSAAHDIEAVRAALNEKKISWIGLSYGTQLGAAYAELYPEHVGRMVLDGNVDHSLSETSALAAEASTYEETLNQFFEWCNTTATEEECPLKNQNLPQIFDDLVANADKSPIPAAGCVGENSTCRPFVTGEDIQSNVQGAGYLAWVRPMNGVQNSGWPTLAQVLNQTIAGDATGLSSGLAMSETDPSYPSIAIGCLDWYHNATNLPAVTYKQQMGKYVAPHTKGSSQTYRYQTACIGWPAPVQNPNHLLNQKAMVKAPPILMVNSYHDPEASYVWAEGLHAQIPNSVLLSRNGSGHTSYSLGGAATAIIDDYLANGTLPEPNTVVDS